MTETKIQNVKMVKAIIDGFNVEVPEGTTILDAAQKVKVDIPVLCKHPNLPATALCGICVVKVKGMPNMIWACCTPVAEGNGYQNDGF